MQLYAALRFLAECAHSNLVVFSPLPELFSSDVHQVYEIHKQTAFGADAFHSK